MGPSTGTLSRFAPGTRLGLAAAIVILVVLAVAIATNRPKWEPQPIVAVTDAADQTTLEVTVAHGGCPAGDPKVRVDESDDEVRIRAEQDVHGDCESVENMSTLELDLDRPLAERPLVVEPPAEPYETECTISRRPDESCVG